MKVAVWKTGHQIADTVANALITGLRHWNNGVDWVSEYSTADMLQAGKVDPVQIAAYSAHIGYGILRGTSEVFSRCEKLGIPWFNVDKGYISPGHFDGTYRISHKSTQAIWHDGAPSKPVDIKLEPFERGGAWALICPPTEEVCKFYNISLNHWLFNAYNQAQSVSMFGLKPMIRQKGDTMPLDEILPKTALVITFNSSVGWEAVRRGIPCLSDVNHSTVGSFYGETVTDLLLEKFYSLDRMKLFNFMAAHQFTLDEIAQGKEWDLIKYYLQRYSSDTIAGKLSVPMSRPTRFAGAPAPSPTSGS